MFNILEFLNFVVSFTEARCCGGDQACFCQEEGQPTMNQCTLVPEASLVSVQFKVVQLLVIVKFQVVQFNNKTYDSQYR